MLTTNIISHRFISYVIVISCLSLPKKSFPQSYQSQQTQIFAYNILLNGIIGGIGGAINKKQDEKFLLAFGKNFLKGSLGGLIKYTAKYETFYLGWHDKRYLAKPNRLFYYLGYSFVYNASLNRKLTHSYHCQLYGANMEFIFEKDFHIRGRVSLLTLSSLTIAIAEGHHFDLFKSIEYGLFYFDQNAKYDSAFFGRALHNVIIIPSSIYRGNPWRSPHYFTFPHEIVHTYQSPDYFPISNWFNQSLKKIKEHKSYEFLQKYVYLDIPYHRVLYLLQPQPKYYKNFYEFEAQHFAMRNYIDR